MTKCEVSIYVNAKTDPTNYNQTPPLTICLPKSIVVSRNNALNKLELRHSTIEILYQK